MTETTRVVRLFVRFGMLLVGIGMIFAAAPTLIGNTTDWRAVAPVLLLLSCLVVLSIVYDRMERK